jgi:LacI family transcriptional regulator
MLSWSCAQDQLGQRILTEVIMARISETQLRRQDRVVTIRDVAEATKLSVATVSMVLNRIGRRIPPATHRLVEEAAQKLGYSPNLQARSLRSRRTRSIGVLVFDITDPYCSLMIRGIENSLGDGGYMPVLADLQNTPRRVHQCMQMLMERRVEGLIAIANPVHLGSDLSTVIRRFKVPAVIIGGELASDNYASVVVDNQAGMRAAVEYLYALGHRDVAVIKGPRSMTDSAPRWEGIKQSAREKGMRIDRSLVVQIQGHNSSYEQGYQLTEHLLEQNKRFTALLAFDDLTAFAAIGALSRASRRVPEDCSVVGFDDIPGAAFYNPPLTTVCQHLEKQGILGAEMMRALLAPDAEPNLEKVHKIVEPHLVVRRSTAPVAD